MLILINIDFIFPLKSLSTLFLGHPVYSGIDPVNTVSFKFIIEMVVENINITNMHNKSRCKRCLCVVYRELRSYRR